jgi:hypothetical protein
MEEHAKALRTVQFTHLPGLLQTAGYARLVFQQNVPALPPPMIEHRLSHRIKRQGILYSDAPTQYTGIIHEAALRMRFGGPGVMREQLAHLTQMSERKGVTVPVLPFSAGIFPGAGQTVVIAHGPHPQLDTVQLDTEHGSEFLHAEAQLDKYRTIMGRMEQLSLDAADSRDFIHRIVADSGKVLP